MVVLPSATHRLAVSAAMQDQRVPMDILVTDPGEIARRGKVTDSTLRTALREGRVLYERGLG